MLGDHVEAYADLVGDEVSEDGAAWSLRLGLYAAALVPCRRRTGPRGRGPDALGGLAAERHSGALGPDRRAGVTFLLGARLHPDRAPQPGESAFDNVKKQLSADMAMLREVSAP